MSPWVLGPGLLLVGLGGLVVLGEYRWRTRTAAVVARLRLASARPPSVTYSEAELRSLPAPVARYFRTVLRNGQLIVRHARLSQRGEFLLRPGPDGWRPFVATQHFATRPAGFVWDARIRMGPGVSVRVRDALVEETGSMVGAVLGLFRVVSVEGTPDVLAGALHRYLAESVWLPTALLPSQGVSWTALDDTNARATLSLAGTRVSLDFHFDGDGLVSRVFTPGRARDVGGRGVPTPWQGRVSRYEEHGGMRIPGSGEAEWLLPEGPQVYWRGEITAVAFDA